MATAAQIAGVKLLHRQIQANPKRHLICFPHAGGNPAPYLRFTEFLPRDMMLTVVSLQRNRTSAIELIEGLRAWLANAPSESRILFGHSFGGHIAATLAPLVLSARDLLVLSACIELGEDSGKGGSGQPSSDGSFWELLYDLVYIGGISKEAFRSEALVRLAVDSFRYDLGLRDQIAAIPRTPSSSPCLFVSGGNDHLLDGSTLQYWSAVFPSLRATTLPGGHFYFVGNEAELIGLIVSEASRHANVGRATGRSQRNAAAGAR